MNNINEAKINLLTTIIKSSEGKFLSVEFTKKNGDHRKITGRLGVKYNGEPAKVRFDSKDKPFILIWEASTRCFKRVSVDTIQKIHMKGVELNIGEQLQTS